MSQRAYALDVIDTSVQIIKGQALEQTHTPILQLFGRSVVDSKLPSAATDIQFRNDPMRIAATPLGETRVSERNNLARQLLSHEDLALAQNVSGYTSWSLFLEFLARPSVKLWTIISQLYAFHLPHGFERVRLDDASSAMRALTSDLSALPTLAEAADGDGIGSPFSDSQICGLAVATLEGVKERNPAGVFLALRFDDDTALLEADFVRHWRGFLRLLNRVQFLPNTHVVTIRGSRAGAFGGLADAFDYFMAGGGPTPRAERGMNMALVHPALRVWLTTLLEQGLHEPEIGFELEVDGMVAGSAELAWPDNSVAVVPAAASEDQKAFTGANWQVFTFSSDGLAPEESVTIQKILTSAR